MVETLSCMEHGRRESSPDSPRSPRTPRVQLPDATILAEPIAAQVLTEPHSVYKHDYMRFEATLDSYAGGTIQYSVDEHTGETGWWVDRNKYGRPKSATPLGKAHARCPRRLSPSMERICRGEPAYNARGLVPKVQERPAIPVRPSFHRPAQQKPMYGSYPKGGNVRSLQYRSKVEQMICSKENQQPQWPGDKTDSTPSTWAGGTYTSPSENGTLNPDSTPGGRDTPGGRNSTIGGQDDEIHSGVAEPVEHDPNRLGRWVVEDSRKSVVRASEEFSYERTEALSQTIQHMHSGTNQADGEEDHSPQPRRSKSAIRSSLSGPVPRFEDEDPNAPPRSGKSIFLAGGSKALVEPSARNPHRLSTAMERIAVGEPGRQEVLVPYAHQRPAIEVRQLRKSCVALMSSNGRKVEHNAMIGYRGINGEPISDLGVDEEGNPIRPLPHRIEAAYPRHGTAHSLQYHNAREREASYKAPKPGRHSIYPHPLYDTIAAAMSEEPPPQAQQQVLTYQPQFESPGTLADSIQALTGASHTPRTPRGNGVLRSVSSPPGGTVRSRSPGSPTGSGGSQTTKTPQPRRSKSTGQAQARSFQYSLAPRGSQNARTPRPVSASRSEGLATPVKTSPPQADISQDPAYGQGVGRGMPPQKGAAGNWDSQAAEPHQVDMADELERY